MSKQREEFEKAFKNNNAYNIELIHGTNTPTFEQNSKGEYLKISVQNHWEMWQQAQKVAVSDTTAIVLALENVQTEVSQSSFVTMDADNEIEIYAVDANKLSKYIDDLIEAQEN